MNTQRILDGIVPIRDFIFVTSCFHCGRRLEKNEKRICRQCWNSLVEIDEHDFTYSILKKRFSMDGVIDDIVSLYYFEKGNLLQSLAHALKYQEIRQFGIELGERLGKKLQHRGYEYHDIIPVPLNRFKFRERGYNQSEYIAQGIMSVFRQATILNVVQRVKNTTTQTHLNARERQHNVSHAFVVTSPARVQGRSLLIADDIITTGSTIQEVAKILKNSGAAKIVAVSAGLAKLGSGA